MDLNWGQFCHPGDIWQGQEMFPVVKMQEGGERQRGLALLASSRWKPGMSLGILQRTGQLPQQRIIWSKLSTVPRLRNSGLESTRLSCPH